ncbi:c-type cytochrome biogenesis protein CcmI [Acetobacter sp. AN02]|nr:c-type cytochrome biogenesis protein CcmI [Acetobacter sp. AN02]MDG6094570.1 c-type cytochrome biogenesis protein CcmI [Acetobacter sp. AN02]
MTWAGIVILSVITLLPAAVSVRGRTRQRDERETALALHRLQLAELDRDLTTGMIAPAEHGVAYLEVQRRILAADQVKTGMTDRITNLRLWLGLGAVPVMATVLYLTGGQPSLPAQPLKARLAAQAAENSKIDDTLSRLRTALGSLPPDDPRLRQGYLLLGQAEAAAGQYAGAARDWGRALDLKFDPELAAQVAELHVRADGHVSAEAVALFRRALDGAPKDAPWRRSVEARIAEGVHEETAP